MNDRGEWKRSLEACAESMTIAPDRKKAALDKIAHKTARKEIPYRPGWLEILKVQGLSIPVSAWFLQALFLLLLPTAELYLRKKTNICGWEVFPVLSVCMAFGAVVFVNELSRHVSSRMAELEQSCYLNLSQLWLMRVCCISGLDVLAAAAMGVGRAHYYGFGSFSFAVYVLTPFFLANAAMLAFFTMSRNGNKFGCAAIVLLLSAGLCAEFFCSWIYEKLWFGVWLFLLAAAVLVCAAQVKEIGRKMEGGGLCWS